MVLYSRDNYKVNLLRLTDRLQVRISLGEIPTDKRGKRVNLTL